MNEYEQFLQICQIGVVKHNSKKSLLYANVFVLLLFFYSRMPVMLIFFTRSSSKKRKIYYWNIIPLRFFWADFIF